MAAYLERGRKQPSEKAVPKRVPLAQSSWRAALSPFHPVAFSQSASSGARSSPPPTLQGEVLRAGWAGRKRAGSLRSREEGGRARAMHTHWVLQEVKLVNCEAATSSLTGQM